MTKSILKKIVTSLGKISFYIVAPYAFLFNRIFKPITEKFEDYISPKYLVDNRDILERTDKLKKINSNFNPAEKDLNDLPIGKKIILQKILNKIVIEKIDEKNFTEIRGKIFHCLKNLIEIQNLEINNILEIIADSSLRIIFVNHFFLKNLGNTYICSGSCEIGSNNIIIASKIPDNILQSIIIHELTHAACIIKFNNSLQNNLIEFIFRDRKYFKECYKPLNKFISLHEKYNIADPYIVGDSKSRKNFKEACIKNEIVKKSYISSSNLNDLDLIKNFISEPFNILRNIYDSYMNDFDETQKTLCESRSSLKNKESLQKLFNETLIYPRSDIAAEIIARVSEVIVNSGLDVMKESYSETYRFYQKTFSKESFSKNPSISVFKANPVNFSKMPKLFTDIITSQENQLDNEADLAK